MNIENVGPEMSNQPSVSERAKTAVAEAAQHVRELVLSETEALTDVFPQLEVADEVVGSQAMGAIALGHKPYPTTSIPGIIVDQSGTHAHEYKAVVLTPAGLHKAGGVTAVRGNRESGSLQTVPRLRADIRPEEEDLLWLTYGAMAAQKLEELKLQQAQPVA